jgi:hypothetical protein
MWKETNSDGAPYKYQAFYVPHFFLNLNTKMDGHYYHLCFAAGETDNWQFEEFS